MPEPPLIPRDIEERLIEFGRAGMGRWEIASALGVPFRALEATAKTNPDFRAALDRAEDEARAWWEGLPRQAMIAGARFNRMAWRDAMRARFGDGIDKPEKDSPVKILIPHNFRQPVSSIPPGMREYEDENDRKD